MDQPTVWGMLQTVMDGWNSIIVRVRQDGKMQFLPLGDIKDQKLVFKLVRDMITQLALENGMLTKRRRKS